jgi:arginine N-succinyltransferase
MYVMRPVELEDLNRLLELAELTSFGLTTLPKDAGLLEKRIRASIRAFRNLDGDEPFGDAFLFVLEDVSRKLVIGTSGVVSKTGGFEPFYSYQIQTSIHDSRMLNIRKEVQVLHLDENHNGPCEIGSLFLHPDERQAGNGRLLSLSRFLFMAEYPQLFDKEVIAEMRGVIDDRGRSPFWDAVGRHFFEMEFPKADYLSIVNKEFIGDLMPRYPIYIPLLPREAQAVIGEVHTLTRPARRLLESEGFVFRNHVDIFEAGPMLHCTRDNIRSIRESHKEPVSAILSEPPETEDYLLASTYDGFRATRAPLIRTERGVEIPAQAAELLKVGVGDEIRYVTMKSAT